MDKLIITPVLSSGGIQMISKLADSIWLKYLRDISAPQEWFDNFVMTQSKKSITDKIENGGLYFLVTNPKNEYAGYFSVYPQENHLDLNVICFTPENRGKRYGKRIIRVIEWLSRKQGCVLIKTVVPKFNPRAIDFFLANKFDHIGNEYDIDDSNCIMRKITLSAKPSDFKENSKKDDDNEEES